MSVMLPPTPEFRKECSVCYQLLYITHWEMNTNIDPTYIMGSSTPAFIQRQPTNITVKGFCPGCNCEATREYMEVDGTFRLFRESFYQQGPPGHMGRHEFF